MAQAYEQKVAIELTAEQLELCAGPVYHAGVYDRAQLGIVKYMCICLEQGKLANDSAVMAQMGDRLPVGCMPAFILHKPSGCSGSPIACQIRQMCTVCMVA